MNRRNGLILAGIMIGFLALGILAGRFYPHWRNGLPHPSARAIILTADPACNPTGQACTTSDAALAITLELADRIKPLTPFSVRVQLAGKGASEVKKVTVSFTMLNMDMGSNRFDLRQQADTTWQGQALLPVCSMGRRDWRASVEIASDPPLVGEFHLKTNF